MKPETKAVLSLTETAEKLKYLGSHSQVMADKIGYLHRESKCSNAPALSIYGNGARALHKAKLLVSTSANVLILAYWHECWIINEKVRSQVPAAKMGFLRRISGLTLLSKVKIPGIRESLNIDSLLRRLKKSQLRRYENAAQTPPEKNCCVSHRLLEG